MSHRQDLLWMPNRSGEPVVAGQRPQSEILRRHIAETIQRGDQAQVKQLIDTLVAKIIVTDRDEIQPYFYLPAEAPSDELGEQARPLYGSLPPARDTEQPPVVRPHVRRRISPSLNLGVIKI
jgi:hypothetical protein